MTQLKKLRGANISNISVFDSTYCIGFEIPSPASPSFSHYMHVIYKVKTSVLGADEIFYLDLRPRISLLELL